MSRNRKTGKSRKPKSAPKKSRGKAAAKVFRKPAVKKSAGKTKVSGGLSEKLYDTAIKILNDRQAEQIVTVNLAGRSAMADYLIIASGRSARQIAAIADYLRAAFMAQGVRQVRVEGLPQGNWVLVDAGDVVVHLFRPEVRRYYRLEDIWGDEDKNIERASLLLE